MRKFVDYLKSKRVALIVIGLIAVLIVIMSLPQEVVTYHEKYEGVDLASSVTDMDKDDSYNKYIANIVENGFDVIPDEEVFIDLTKKVDVVGQTEILANYEGKSEVLMMPEDSTFSVTFDVAQSGVYNVNMLYFPVDSRGTDIERSLKINGEIPFNGADKLVFERVWKDAGPIVVDNRGNEVRPSQVENFYWIETSFEDYMGYETVPYKFYFEKGENSIEFESITEPMAIGELSLVPAIDNITYEEYLEKYASKENGDTAKNHIEIFEGETSTLRSSPALYADYDRAAPNTEPYSVDLIKMNMIGGLPWRLPGQWVEWNFSVPADGFYTITLKNRQDHQRGFVSSRTVFIDGEVPFEEVSAVGFSFTNEWRNSTLSNAEETPYRFYLEEGEHTLRLEVTLGELGEVLGRLEESLNRLNAMYRQILVLTGATPDKFRDYGIEKVFPDLITAMDIEYKRLYKIVDDVTALTGQKSNQMAVVQVLANQMEKFVEKPYKIAKELQRFKTNIAAIGTLISQMREAALDIDNITICGDNKEPSEVNASLFDKAVHEVNSFFTSFTVDYNSIGSVHGEDEDVIDVWIMSGRDQSDVLKAMIDDTFTPQTGIKVNLKLVTQPLLNAVVAGRGPDVVLNAGRVLPVDYALRGAVEDLTQFDGWDEVCDNFHESAYAPYELDGAYYGIPETQTFDVLFYREDILDELGLGIPQTWDELIDMLPTIQQNNMEVGIQSSSNPILAQPSLLLSMIYQNGGQLYTDNHQAVDLNSPQSVTAFEKFTRYFTHYSFPVEFDFANRFRSGEMPLAVADYTAYNTLSIFAPEIRGLWDFTLIPGTEQADGTIDRSCFGSGTCAMMLKQEEDTVRENSWEFLQWWASAETHARFGREMESILGTAGRYATANRIAFAQMPWTRDQQDVLNEQWEFVEAVPEIPGGYYTFRHISNAIRNVIYNKVDPRETLLEYTRLIDDEITRKRLEFNFDVNDNKDKEED